MKKYEIYHISTSDIQNLFREVVEAKRELVGTVEAENPEDAYIKTQNLYHSWSRDDPKRSTAVGDVVYDVEEKKAYMVKAFGFGEIEFQHD